MSTFNFWQGKSKPIWLEDMRREDNSLYSSVYHRQINAKWVKNNQTKKYYVYKVLAKVKFCQDRASPQDFLDKHYWPGD